MADNIQEQTPVEGAEPTNLTVEQITTKHEAEIKERDGKIAGLNRSITKYQKELTSAKKSNDDRDATMKGMELSLAQLQDLVKGNEGEDATEVKALTVKRAKEAEASVVSPDVIAFTDYLEEEGLKADWEALDDPERTDPIVSEVLKQGGTPVEARRALKKALKAQTDTEVQNRITLGIQQGLKDIGVTAKGPEAPSGSVPDDDAFIVAYSEGKYNSPEDHKRASKILEN